MLPPANLAGEPAPLRDIQQALDAALQARGIAVVPRAQGDAFLSRHRLRWTGGVDGENARAAAEELGAASVLVTTVELYQAADPPRFAMGARLVAASSRPEILWIDEQVRAGDDSPGIFELGLLHDPRQVQDRVLGQLASALRSYLDGRAARAAPCRGGYAPLASYRSPRLEPQGPFSVAVLPFINETRRRAAGEVVALQFVRQLAATPGFRVLEPGVIRNQLTQYRITMEDGISLDVARVLLELVDADFVLAGTVRDYSDPATSSGTPVVQFSALLLERKNSEVVWQSTSFHRGDEGVFFFDVGHVPSAPGLACRMVASAVDALVAGAKTSFDAQKLRIGGGR